MNIIQDFRDAFRKQNNGLNQLIWLNVAVYLAFVLVYVATVLLNQEPVFDKIQSWFTLSTQWREFLIHPWTFFTYAFVHSLSPFSILINMLVLYWFGNIIEEFVGSRRLVSIYLLGGFAGGIFSVLFVNFVPAFQGSLAQHIMGSWGSVLAVMMAAATLVPEYTFFLILIGPVRIKYIVGFYFILTLVMAVSTKSPSEVAALGGIWLGYLFIKQLRNGYDWGEPLENFLDFCKNLFKPTPKPVNSRRSPQKQVVQNTASTISNSKSDSYYPDEEEIDAILDKISRSGIESLSRDERRKLDKASQK